MTQNTADIIALARNGDERAREKMLEENSGLIWSIARRYFGRGVDAEDLYQLGCLGFYKAIQGYDPSFGTQFSTYAVPKISGEIRRFLRDDGPVKVSRSIKERALHIKSAREELYAQLGREPTLSELAEKTLLTPEEIAVAETAVASTESLQRETGEDGMTLEGVIGVDGMEENILERLSIKSAVNQLPEKEKIVIILRYYRGLTQEKTARIVGVSQVQISRLERKAITSLREILTG